MLHYGHPVFPRTLEGKSPKRGILLHPEAPTPPHSDAPTDVSVGHLLRSGTPLPSGFSRNEGLLSVSRTSILIVFTTLLSYCLKRTIVIL